MILNGGLGRALRRAEVEVVVDLCFGSHFGQVGQRCAGGGRFDVPQRVVFWLVLALGLVTIVTMLGTMTAAFGYDGIRALCAFRRIRGMGLVGVGGVAVGLPAVRGRGGKPLLAGQDASPASPPGTLIGWPCS